MQDNRSDIHKSLSMQLARIAAEKAAKSVDYVKQVRQSVASQVLGPKSRFAAGNSSTKVSPPKPYEFGFSVLNELKRRNLLKNPLSRSYYQKDKFVKDQSMGNTRGVFDKDGYKFPNKPSVLKEKAAKK